MTAHVLFFGLVLGWLPVARSTVYRDRVYEVTSLTEELINVDIRSNIPGTIRWENTDDDILTVSLNISASNQLSLDDVIVHFWSNSSVIALQIDSISRQKAAAVTGKGNRGGHVIVLIWLTLFTFNLRYARVLLMLLVANGLVYCMASAYDENRDDTHVELVVFAPRRFRYKDSNLVVAGGRVRLVNSGSRPGDFTGISCSGGGTHPGCMECCYSNGVCSNSGCLCDKGFNPEYNCSTPLRDDTYFSHPLDPRLVRTVTSTGDVITLSDISNSDDKIGKNKDQDTVYLDIQSKVNQTSVFFSTDGFIKRIQSKTGNVTRMLQIKRSRDVTCKSTLIASTDLPSAGSQSSSKFLFDIDACQKTVKMVLRKPLMDIMTKAERIRLLRKRISATRSRIMNALSRDSAFVGTEKLVGSGPYVDIPVSAQRCAQERALNYNVVFEMKSRDTNGKSEIMSRVTSIKKVNRTKEKSVLLNTHTMSDSLSKNRFLRLPKGQWATDHNKCNLTVLSITKVCRKDFILFYNQICRLAAEASYDPKGSLPYKFADICSNVLKAIKHLCDIPLGTNQLKDSSQEKCFSDLVKIEKLFSSSVYSLRPRVIFADGKTIIGKWIVISPISIMNIQNEGIVIKDDKPEVRISQITVVPTDPVPQDIYHVRLDYTCATNQTVIRMNVTGSDLYKNHVMCKGITECGCCILHAAGAPDAVVDHVTINITDSLSGVYTFKEMVVVF